MPQPLKPSRAFMQPEVRRRVYLWHAGVNAKQYEHFIINYARSTVMKQVLSVSSMCGQASCPSLGICFWTELPAEARLSACSYHFTSVACSLTVSSRPPTFNNVLNACRQPCRYVYNDNTDPTWPPIIVGPFCLNHPQ